MDKQRPKLKLMGSLLDLEIGHRDCLACMVMMAQKKLNRDPEFFFDSEKTIINGRAPVGPHTLQKDDLHVSFAAWSSGACFSPGL